MLLFGGMNILQECSAGPAAHCLNGGVFDICHCGSGGRTNSKTMTGVLEAQRIQNVLDESLRMKNGPGLATLHDPL